MVIRVQIEERGSGRSAVLYGDEVLTVGRGAVVCAAARKLLKRGHDPGDRLEAWRGDMPCLTGPVGIFAGLTVEDRADGGLRWRLYRPGAGVAAGAGVTAQRAILPEAA